MSNKIKFIDEKLIEEQMRLVIEMQFLIQSTMNELGISRAQLAERMGVSKARLTQLMRAEANPTLYTIADVFHSLGKRMEFRCVDELVISAESFSSNLSDWEMETQLKMPAVDRIDGEQRAKIARMLDHSKKRLADNDAFAFAYDPECLAA